MKISIVITCFNEKNNIKDVLESLIKQVYSDDYEIIVADGNSRDGTIDIIKEYSNMHNNIKLIVETKRGTAAGRNTGFKAASFDYIAFIDADCEAPENWLDVLARGYKEIKNTDDKIIGVCGKNIPPTNANSFVKAIGIALDSFVGCFKSAHGRQFNAPTYINSPSTLNVLYEKQKLIEVNGFDESLLCEAEDADINYRLSLLGYKFIYIPESYVWHKMRSTPVAWIKNIFKYGKGRARLLKRYPNMWNINFCLPIIFILGMVILFLSPFSPIFLLPLLYFPIIICFSMYQALKKKCFKLVPYVILVYTIQHFAYAIGEVYGLLNQKVK